MIAERILYEDNHLIAVNKLPGEIVQGDKTGDATLTDAVKQYIKTKYDKPGEVFLGVVHRLDRPVSGVVVFARTSKALARMNELFRERKTEKVYWAVVNQQPPKEKDTLVHFLRKNEQKNKSYASDSALPGSLRCELSYELLASSDRYFLLEVHPLTGRHHQIRVQLSTMGCIIKGDLKYGAERSNEDGSIHLHARKLSFTHPVSKQEINVVAPVPEEKLWKYFDKEVG